MATSVQDFLKANTRYVGQANTANRTQAPAPQKGKKGSGNQSWLSSIISELGGAGGAAGGAAAGAALGSVVPGIGNIIGGIAGGVIGGFGGGTAGRLVENQVRDKEMRLGDALKEGAVSGAFGGVGPAWQGVRGVSTLGKAGGGGLKAGIGALSGISDDAARSAAGKAISQGGKKAATSLLYGGENLNALQVAGRGIAGNAQGVGIGAKAPGLNNLGAQAQDDILAALKKVGLGRNNPEKAIRGLEPILNNKGASIAKAYANSTKKFTTQELGSVADDIARTIANDPSIELSKAASDQLSRKLALLAKSDTPEALWNFQKDMGKAINFGKNAEAKLVDREAVARVIRSKTGELLDSSVKEVSSDRALYHTLKDADKLMRVASRQADKTGIVARVMTSAPVRGGEAKLGGALESAGNVLNNQVLRGGAKMGRGMLARGISNQFMQPMVQDPTQEQDPTQQAPQTQDTTLYGADAGMGNPQYAPEGQDMPQESAYSLQQAIADMQANPDAKSRKNIMDYYDFVSKAEAAQAKDTGAQKYNSTAAGVIADTTTGLQALQNLKGTIASSNVNNPIVGQIRGMNPFDTNAQNLQSQIGVVKQIVGKALEGGVLRKEDEVKYAKILPKLGDSDAVAQNKINQLYELISQRLNLYKQSISGGSDNQLADIISQFNGGQ